ncbi:hypothetical protein ABPG72_021964 [Tetrahymena utriculariae]
MKHNKYYLFSLFYFTALVTFTRQTEYLVSQDFTDPKQSSTTGWSLNTIYTCTSTSQYVDWVGNQNFNGVLQQDIQQRTYNSLPPHWSLSLRFDLLLYGEVDQSSGEQIQIVIDGNLQDTFTKNSTDGDIICYNIIWLQHYDELILYQKNITHSQNSVNIKIVPNANNYSLNRGFGFKNYYLYIDTCDYSCATCNGPTQNQCLTCPTNSNKSGNSCTCSSGYFQHQYSCVTSCPSGFVKSNTSNKCVSDYSINCQTYNSSTQLCTQCKSSYYLFQGLCVSSCPQTSSLVSNTCVDFSNQLINGQYLLNGLFSNYFGQSEITGLGLTISNFKGFKSDFGSSGALTTNCGPNHVLGGFWLSGLGASISRVWNGLAPHWSIRIDYTVWKIDKWNNEYFYVSVDGQVKQQLQFSSSSGSNNFCGYGSFNDLKLQQTVNVTHSSSSLNLMFSNNLASNVRTESFALSNIFVLVDFCSSNCLACNASGCTTCQASYFLYNYVCVLTCPTSTYLSNPTTCVDCNSNCQTCNTSSTFCTSCYSPNYLIQSRSLFLSTTGNKCSSSCQTSEFQNTTNNQCTPCDSSCLTCSGSQSNQCLSCQSPRFFQASSSTCVLACNLNQYSQTTPVPVCQNCDSSCATCSGPANTNCLSCSGSNFLDSTTNSCVTTCPNGTYKNTTNNKCSPCDPTCTTCNGPSNSQCLSCTLPKYYQSSTGQCVDNCNLNYKTNCLSCSGSQFLDSATNSCVTTCPNGTYQNLSNNQCSPCDPTCTTCNGPTSSQCLTCTLPKYFQLTSGQCVNNCNTNQYQDNSSVTCQNCNSNCASCSGGAQNNCLSCSGSLFLDLNTNTCVSNCPLSYYKNTTNNQCSKCNSSCATCNGGSIYNCLSCNIPLYFEPLTNTCVSSCLSGQYKDTLTDTCLKCDSTCSTCSIGGANGCSSCVLPLYYQASSSSCVQSCQTKQYQDNLTATCSSCDSSCASCSGPGKNECLMCSGSLYFDSTTKQCVNKCPDSYFADLSTNICKQCDPSCKTCNGNLSTNCQSCILPLYFNPINQKCVSDCDQNQYKDRFYSQASQNQCQPCFSTCQTCSGPSANECLGCPQDTFLKGSTCVNKCGDGYFLNQDKCSQCHPSCKNCQGENQDQCTECPDILFKYNSKCLSDCPSETYQLQASQKQCFQCSSSCSSGCNGPSEKNCNSLKPQNQIIVYILSAKTVIWVISSFIGIFQDQKNKKTQNLTVVPSSLAEKQLDFEENDSPIRRKKKKVFPDIYTQNITLNDSPVNKSKQNGKSDNGQLPLFNQNEGFKSQFEYQQTNKDENQKSEANLQDKVDKSPKYQMNRRRPRKTQLILNTNLKSQCQLSINALSSQVNMIDSSPINSKRQFQDQQIAVTSAVSPLSQQSRNFDKQENSHIQKYQANQKLKYSFLGNEWIELFAFYDPYVKRASRITLIYLKYHMFFFICENFKFSPEYYLSVCLASGLSMKLIIEKILFFMTKYTSFGNLLSMILFLGALGADFYYWFIPKIQSVNYNMDYSWSFQYLITFSADFLILQQLLGLLKYLSTVKFMNLKNPSIELLFSQDFTDPTQSSTTGWFQNTIDYCNPSSAFIDWAGNQNVNGIFQQSSQQRTYSSPPPHWSLSIRFDFLLYGGVDQTKGDQIQIFIDGNLQDTYTKNSKRDGFLIFYKIVFLIQCFDELILYHKNITHSLSSVTMELLPTCPSDKLNKGFGFKSYYLYLDTCDNSCATCNGPNSNQCLTCPVNSVKSGSSCACAIRYIQHQYQCVTNCPTGFVKSLTVNKCITDFSINCQTYNSSSQLCSTCKPSFYLYQGQCATSCPQTSSLSSNICVDFSSTLIINLLAKVKQQVWDFLLIILNDQSLALAKVELQLPTVVLIIYQEDFGSPDKVLAQADLGQEAPHWSIKIVFTVWKIDQWSNENFKINVLCVTLHATIVKELIQTNLLNAQIYWLNIIRNVQLNVPKEPSYSKLLKSNVFHAVILVYLIVMDHQKKTDLRPQNLNIVYILFSKITIWVLSSTVGMIQDQRNKKSQNLTVVPSNFGENQFNFERNDSPIRMKLKKVKFDVFTQNEVLKDQNVDKIKQFVVNEKEQLPTFNSNERLQFDNQLDFQAENNDVNAKSELNLQNQEEQSPKWQKRRKQRKTQFILKANIMKSSQLSMNALSSQVNIIDQFRIKSKRQLHNQSEVAFTVAPQNLNVSKIDNAEQSLIERYKLNEKLKYSIVNFQQILNNIKNFNILAWKRMG